MLGDLAARYRNVWKGAYGESLDALRADVVDLLEALRLARRLDDGLAIFPFAARYQPQVTNPAQPRQVRGDDPMSQQRAPRRFDERWRLSRAGIVNVWHYLDNEFDLSGGRMILRGTNGSGKSRALEMLLPFLLDADRRRMDATGAARVNLDELMRTGAQGQSNRTGYLWLELCRRAGPAELGRSELDRSELGQPDGYLTVGALIRHSQSASSTKVWYFTYSAARGRRPRAHVRLPRAALS